MPMKMKVAVIQMVSCSAVGPNLMAAKLLVQKAADEGAKLIVLPENFALVGKDLEDVVLIKEEFGPEGRLQHFVANLAKRNQVWIVGGTLPIACAHPHQVRSASIVWNEQGQVVGRYDKIHMFDVFLAGSGEHYEESKVYERGSEVVVVPTPFGKLGLSICYDLRFPELYYAMREKGAEIFTVPSAFTSATGRAHWTPLLQARAIENQAYILAANQGGIHDNGRATYGHSMIVGPWGNVLSQQESGIGYAIAEIDLLRLQILREDFPVWSHRQLGGMNVKPNSR